jgi:hypothetical protein
VNEKGEIVGKAEDEKTEETNSKLVNDKKDGKNSKQYTPIGQYKPTGSLVYNPEIFEKIEKKVTFS